MKSFAYCCASFKKSVAKASGAKPWLSPPLDQDSIYPPNDFTGFEFLYFKLHGLEGQPYWYGDRFETTALHIDQIQSLHLPNTVVFVANCFFDESPWPQAWQATGAAVIGGPGPNYALGRGLLGADLLGRAVRRLIKRKRTASLQHVLDLAKYEVKGRVLKMRETALALQGQRRADLETRIQANEDALNFKLYV